MLALAALVGAVAWAGPTPMVEGHGLGVVESTGAEALQGAGAGASVGLRAFKPLWGELLVDASWIAEPATAGLDADALPVRVGLLGQLRVFLTPRDARHAAVSVALGLGLDVVPRPALLAHAAGALDVYVHRDVSLRFEGGYLAHVPTGGGARLALGVVWSPRRPEPEPEPVAEVPPAPWQLFPVCAWTDEEAAMAAIAARESELRRALAGDDGGRSSAAAQGGGLLVVGLPGDRMRLEDGTDLAADRDGIALLRAPAALVDVRVVGGGREEVLPAQFVDGHATWVRASAPPERRLHFAKGSAALLEDESEALAAWAAHTAGWSWELHGSFSPEGSEAGNFELAKARARAVAEALVAAGVPRAQVVEGEPELPAEGLAGEEQRIVRLVPVLAHGGAP